mgnify:CR=1 FL=1
MKVDFEFGSLNGKRSVVAVGCFDGVHTGHLSILERVKKIAHESGLVSLVASFEPHPREVLSGQSPLLLSPKDERTYLLKAQGIGAHALITFDKEMASMGASDYIEAVLIDKLRAQTIVVGYDHRFGRNREGDTDLLRTVGSKHGITVVEAAEASLRGAKISSSSIRDKLAEGEVATAAQLLGRLYSFQGTVVHGDGRGKSIGIPTANLQSAFAHKLVPQNGVYAVYVEVEGIAGRFGGMMNIGTRPTFNNGSSVTLEVHILNFDRDIYDREVRVEFVERIRNEQKFASVAHLMEQLNLDQERCNGLLKEIL